MALSQNMHKALQQYIDFDFLDELSVPRQKKTEIFTAFTLPNFNRNIPLLRQTEVP